MTRKWKVILVNSFIMFLIGVLFLSLLGVFDFGIIIGNAFVYGVGISLGWDICKDSYGIDYDIY